MLFTPRALHSSSVAIFIVFSVVCMAASSSSEFCSPKPPSCDCSNTPDGYELRCSTFTVQVKPKAVVQIQCDNNVVSDFSVLSGMGIGKVDTLTIRLCPLGLMSLNQLMKNMGVFNVSNVLLTSTGVNGNSATAVTRELFHGLSNVTSLTLHTNGTTQLTNDVFTDMPNLTFIDLKSNHIVLSKDVFCNVMNLQVLLIGSNNQTYLETGVFHNLINLRLLALRGNMIKLSRTVFSDTYNLQSLDINSTKLNSLPSDLFVDLKKLRKINLYANEFISLPHDLFINNSELETINLQDNRRTLNTLPRRMLAGLTKLKIVTIRNCNMTTLPVDLLWGSASIQTISLNNNAFLTLPEKLFKDCTKLETLDVSYNRITDLPNKIFSSTTNLKSLKINNNQLSVITKHLFLSLRNLIVLDLKDNRLTHTETQAFETLTSLKEVNMSNNMLTFEGTSENGTTSLSPLKFCDVLENIQLANNSLIRIFPDWRDLKNLETLNIAHNKISQIRYADFGFVSKKDISVNVSYNNISEIDIVSNDIKYFGILLYFRLTTKPLSITGQKEDSKLADRYIFSEGNFIKCDCKVPSFLLPRDKNIAIFKIMMDTEHENSQCVKSKEYRENIYQFFSIKLVSCLLRKRQSLNCPEQCSCLLMISGKALLVDCSQRNLTSMATREDMLHNISRAVFTEANNLEFLEINSIKVSSLPSDILLDLTELQCINLYGNEFLSLPQNLFVNNQNLKAVNIEANRRTLSTLPPRWLANFTKLDDVILRSCNMSTLPKDLLWGSRNIRFIFLNRNSFTTLPELLFKDSRYLELLDISYNRITDLPIPLFSGLTNLLHLRINNNQLSLIPNNLFSSLRNLIILDLKDNRLKHIESQAFIALKDLRTLSMSNNLLTFSDASINTKISPLKFCSMLEDLQMANNSVTKIFIDWQQFKKLHTLNLAYNKISHVKAEDFYVIGAKSTFVNISYNNISEMDIFENNGVYKYVSESAVYNVPVRHYFIEGNPINCDCKVYRFLQYNGEDITAEIKLTTKMNTSSLQCVKLEAYTGQLFWKIPIQPLICLQKIKYILNCPKQCSCLLFSITKRMVIDCHQTNLTSMPGRENVLHNLTRELFSDSHDLESLDIKWNRMTGLPQDLFVDLINLRKIIIYETKFQSLPHDLFVNNEELEMINIENNGVALKTLPPRLLAGLTKLKEVKLDSCNISNLPGDLLRGSTSIITVSLKNNALTTLPEQLFIECSELMTLDISFNQITDLPNDLLFITRNLKTLKINNNQLTSIRKHLFYYLSKLEVLDLKCNRLTVVEYEAFGSLSSLKAVDMSNNMLTFEDSLSWSLFATCPNLEDIQLAKNSLTSMSYGWYHLKNLQTLNLAHNKISHLPANGLALKSTKDVYVNVSYNNISEIHILSKDTVYKYVPVTGIYNVPVRHCNLEGNPINCDCKEYGLLQYRYGELTARVKLTFRTEPPHKSQCVKLEGHTKELSEDIPIKYFTCLFGKYYSLNCPENCSCLFRTSDNALRVDCQQRNLTSMPESLPDITFCNYTELNLSRNKIKSIEYPLGQGYNKVTKYILSENMISEIDLTAFSPKVQTLELDGNNLNQFNKSSIEFLMNSMFLTQLSLHNNPWSCGCTTKNFVNVIRSIYNLRKIKTLGNVTCEKGKEILQMSETELCPVEPKIIINENYTNAILGLLFGLLIGLLLVLFYKFQNGIKIWLYAHRCCMWFVTEDELDKDKLYDIFVSYAHQDEEFVMEHLVPRLEDDDHYTLCLHQRDWIPGEFISAQIIRSVEASRRTLIILSTAFLESVWGIMEFRVAHEQAMRDRRVRVIVILYGDIGPTDKLVSELRTYVTTNTYVKWGDKWFWEKLRYALPHSSELRTEIPLQEIT